MMKNINQRPDLKLRVNENWDSVFKVKKNRPSPLMGSKGFLKYHSKGIFYLDCKFMNSHKDLNYNDTLKRSGFVKQLQGELYIK